MQWLQHLLHRIKWDSEFGRGQFALGYEDRVAHREQVVLLASVVFDPKRSGTFSVRQEDGTVATIPLHRVRTVHKNGEVIWQRPARPPHP